jgi:hypothetical protein
LKVFFQIATPEKETVPDPVIAIQSFGNFLVNENKEGRRLQSDLKLNIKGSDFLYAEAAKA